MDQYYVNNRTETNPHKDHEVHKAGCRYMPIYDRTALGLHRNCKSAVLEAKKKYSNSDGCKTCCPECHSH